MLRLYISGFERQCGKTLIAAGLAATMQSLGYSTGVYKPIQSGIIELNGFKTSPDLMHIKQADPNILTATTYLLNGHEAPLFETSINNIQIDLNTIISEYTSFSKSVDCAIIEGSNGITTPISINCIEADILKKLSSPSLIVINPKNNIESVISGLKFLETENIKPIGIVINQYNANSNNPKEKFLPQIIAQHTNIPIIGTIPNYENFNNISPETLISEILNKLSIEQIFGLKIAKLN